jgi:hypothetical protein
MKESVSTTKAANVKAEFSPARSNKSAFRARTEPERQLGSLRSVIDTITRDGTTPSAESIAAELSAMQTAQRASVLLGLQRTHGNRYVQRVVAQAKLMVGQTGDKYEQEADQVAKQVVNIITFPVPQPVQRQEPEEELQMKPIQRQELPEEEKEELQLNGEPVAIQRQEQEEELMMKHEEGRVGPQGGPIPPEVEPAIRRAPGGGQPLDGALQAQMGEAMGHDFSGVRVHTDAEADKLNRIVGARAFTSGQDIFFRDGQYDPSSSAGQHLLAHELTHVVQQGTGRVSGGESGMTVRPDGDAFEEEADAGSRAVRSHQIIPSTQGEAGGLTIPDLASPGDILALQRTVGNPAVTRLLVQPQQVVVQRDPKDYENPVTPAKFKAENIVFASAEGGKVGSIYFKQERIRLKHRNGPEIGKTHDGIERYTLPENKYSYWLGTKIFGKKKKGEKRKVIAPGAAGVKELEFEKRKAFLNGHGEEAKVGGTGRLIENWRGGTHPSRGTPVQFAVSQRGINIIYNLIDQKADNNKLGEEMAKDDELKKIKMNEV